MRRKCRGNRVFGFGGDSFDTSLLQFGFMRILVLIED